MGEVESLGLKVESQALGGFGRMLELTRIQAAQCVKVGDCSWSRPFVSCDLRVFRIVHVGEWKNCELRRNSCKCAWREGLAGLGLWRLPAGDLRWHGRTSTEIGKKIHELR
jgi:hypothetical protein